MDYVPVYADEAGASDSNAVPLSAGVARKLGVRTVPVGFGPLSEPIRATGIVQFNEHSVREVLVRAEGWVEELGIRAVGDTVQVGQPLLKVFSPRLETAEQEFVNSLQFDDAARVAVAERRLTDLGLEPAFVASLRETRRVPHLIPFHAQIGGVVIELNVRQGSYVEPTRAIMRLAALDPAWVILEIPESAAADVAVGGTVALTAPGYPGRVFDGQVDHIYPDLDPMTRVLRVRALVPNEDKALKPNMYVSAVLSGGAPAPVVHVPREAVIRDGDTARVIVERGANQFVPRAVQIGREVDGELVVLSGLTQGERVVTSAIFLIDSEASLRASLARLDSSQGTSGASDAGSSQH